MNAEAGHHQNERALRFFTAGSVDDGKSTLIGRLLFEAEAVMSDQILSLERSAKGQAIDLALLTDGLEAEREQGITIDVAYRYFATPRRKFIIADAPGHEQYTRNMVTAASGSDAAIVLVDVTKLNWQSQPVDLLVQTRRHALLAHKLRVPNILFAINKLDAIDDAAVAYHNVRQALLTFALQAGIAEVTAVLPISALRGDNVKQPLRASWYDGPSLLQLLEELPGTAESTQGALKLATQYVGLEEDEGANPVRVCWGRIVQGRVQPGDAVEVFPSREHAVVAGVKHAGRWVTTVQAGQSAGVILDRPVDVSRGDWLAAPDALQPVSRFVATLAWLDTEPAQVQRKYWLRHAHKWVQGRLLKINHRLDIHSLEPIATHALNVNEIGTVLVELQQPLPLTPYGDSRVGGALIVVDPSSNRTSGALLVEDCRVNLTE